MSKLIILMTICLAACSADVGKSKADDVTRLSTENARLKERAVFCQEEVEEQSGESCQAYKNTKQCEHKMMVECLKGT